MFNYIIAEQCVKPTAGLRRFKPKGFIVGTHRGYYILQLVILLYYILFVRQPSVLRMVTLLKSTALKQSQQTLIYFM